MGSYSRILAVPRVPSLLATGTLARLPIGINGLAVVLLLQDERGSFGIAGLAAGALALGTGVGTPLMARVVDRTGPRVLGLLAILCAIGLLALLAVAASAPPVLVVLLAGVTGAVAPPVSSLLRALYPKLLRGPSRAHPRGVRPGFRADGAAVHRRSRRSPRPSRSSSRPARRSSSPPGP